MRLRLGLFRSAHTQTDEFAHGDQRVRQDKHPDSTRVCLENFNSSDLLAYLRRHAKRNEAYGRLLRAYDLVREFPDMSNFRLGPNMFDRIARDWFIFVDHRDAAEPTRLIGHGVATRIGWDGNAATLPRGWQGAVRQAFINAANDEPRDTMVGLFIHVERPYRAQGWASQILDEMLRCARRGGFDRLIIPLRLPTRYQRENACVPFSEFAARTRPDGAPADHWLRLHVGNGAKIVALCNTSHQHAMHPVDFEHLLKPGPLTHSGDHVVCWNGEWYNVHVDLEREFVVMNEGCVWVQYDVDAPGAQAATLT